MGFSAALGRLANEELRQWKMMAHKWFDPIAIDGLINEIYPVFVAGISNRNKAYQWLANEMGIKKEYCHIGMFDVEECKDVVRICQPLVEKITGTKY